MPDWSSPQEIAKEGGILIKFMHALLGLYAYEWLLSLDFEFDLLRGKKKFRWPLIFYFANRYLLLFALIGIITSFDTTKEIDCQAIFTFNQIAGDAAVGLASISLSIRTMAIWAQNRYIVGLLVAVILGHWSLILQGVQLKAVWVPEAGGCVITETNNRILAAIFIYSMVFDFLVLLLNTYKLAGVRSGSDGLLGKSRLAKMIFTDGLIYFILAFIANLLATVFMVLNLNQIMSVIFNVPAAVCSTIVACRVVRRLTSFTQGGPDVYASSQSAGHHLKGPAASLGARGVSSRTSPKHGTAGVHVQAQAYDRISCFVHFSLAKSHSSAMETFTRAEEGMDIEYFGAEMKRPREGSDTDVEVDLEKKGAL
ncbi:hypothetical protein D9756_006443 [Leucocoprinus leucothites]|uniref:Transmembrane protein n=1 Tax=Leucocoprinus leucothites TaxID=201217 RepID=A0A8H5G206_9AGAR|nr:hypothetical protein D9756_006443 [Leucoagaricus leucothites]